MKLCYFNDFRLGVIKGDQVVDVTDAAKGVPHRDTRDLIVGVIAEWDSYKGCLLYTSPSPRDGLLSRMPSSA